MKARILTAAALVLGLAPAAARAQRVYTVKIDSIPQGAAVYLEAKEAGVQGYTPHTFKLKRGSYTFMLEADGYQPLGRTVAVSKSSQFTFTLIKNPDPAVLSVTGSGESAAGATVKINGKEVGKVPMNVSLQPGRYLLEVTRDGHKDFNQWLDVQQAEKRTVTVNLAKLAPGTGNLLVSSSVVGAEVYVDGRKLDDTAPTLVEKLTPGNHVVEVRAKGYLDARQDVTVEVGKTIKVNLELKPDQQTVAASGGTLMVLASEKDVEIFVDGQSKGKAPARVEGLAEGSHLVEGRKPGLTPAEQTVAVKKGEFQTIKLTLKAPEPPRKTGAIRVVTDKPGAEVFIDGALAGKTPLLRHQLDPGPHFVTVKRTGHADVVQTVEVKAGQISELKAKLVATASHEAEGKPDAEVGKAAGEKEPKEEAKEPADETIGLSSYGGQLVGPSYFTGDVSFGFPHIFEGRLTAGLFSMRLIGMDGGVEFRTYGAVSEVGLHTKFRVYRRSAFALAVLFALGGGGGPASRNTFYTNLGVVASMWFKRLVTFSARAYFNFYTDRHCPGSQESGELSICNSPEEQMRAGLKGSEMRDRFGGARFLLSAILEVPVHKRISLFLLFEGAPAQGNRRAYTDDFADIMPEGDPAVYGRLGGTFKY